MTRWLARLAIIAVVGACAAVLVAGIVDTGRLTRHIRSQAAVRADEETFRTYACLEGQLRAAVPDGARVYVATRDPALFQRLTEIATPWTTLTRDLNSASYTIDFGPTGTQPSCAPDFALVVVRR